MNNAINEIKNTLEATNGKIMETEDRISDVEDKMVEINQTGKKKNELKEMRTISETSRTMLNAPTFKSQESQKKTKKKDDEKILEEIIVENFPKMGKEIITQVQETQRVPNRIIPRRNTPRHILIKLTKIRHKEQILKAAREKKNK